MIVARIDTASRASPISNATMTPIARIEFFLQLSRSELQSRVCKSTILDFGSRIA